MSGAIIVGAGPGIGRSVALRFAREGLPVALIARTAATVGTIARELPAGALALTADCADEAALRTALDTATATLGPPDAVVYNAAIIRADAIGDLSVREHQHAWAVNVGGAIATAAHLLPAMAGRGHGTFIVTGGMPEPKPSYASLSLGKAGVRALVDLLHRQYAGTGLRIATVTVAGAVAPGTPFDPDDIADRYWHLHHTPRSSWEEVFAPAGLGE